MSNITIFENPIFGSVRISMDASNEPLFCAVDVCKALGYAKPQNAVATHVEKDDALKQGITDNLGRVQMATFVTESGLYALIFGSKLERAKEFKHWVTSEVLPSIRKTGQYSISQPTLNDKLQANITFADWTIKTLNLNEASKICWAKKIAEKFDIPTDALPSGVNAGTDAPTLHAAKDLLKENNIPFTSVAFNRILMAKGVIHEATRPSRDKNKPWKWKVLNKGFECFGQNIQDPNFQSQTQIKWYDNRFRDLLEFVGIEVPQMLGF